MIGRILAQISKRQEKDGSFRSMTLDAEGAVLGEGKTTFVTSLILISLGRLREYPETRRIARKAVRFLMAQKSPAWSWNYYQRGSGKALRSPCPDDLDDTAAALAAISLHAPELLDGKAWAAITHLLTHAEAAEGGPYNTWIVSDRALQAWRDIDPGVNLNIAYFLSLHKVALPRLAEYLSQALRKDPPPSRYYDFPALAYFAARACSETPPEAIRNFLRKKILAGMPKGRGRTGGESPLRIAISLTALLRLGHPPERLRHSTAALLKTAAEAGNEKARGPDGGWKTLPLYIEEKKPDPHFCGSPELTAALVAEALEESRLAEERGRAEAEGRGEKIAAEAMHEAVLTSVRRSLAAASQEFLKQAEPLIASLAGGDPGRQITLLAYRARRSFSFAERSAGKNAEKRRKGQEIRKIPDRAITELGAANLLGWIAYKIYDDILDDEGDPALLPLANICLQESDARHAAILPPEARHLFRETMDGIERANLWERMHCRISGPSGDFPLPDYGSRVVLAEKSFGHALGPITLLILAGFPPRSREAAALRAFFRHYLIARQLGDDAHDWQDDLARGFVNSASAVILGKARRAGAAIGETETAPRSRALQEIFWKEALPEIAATVFTHAKKARAAIALMRKLGILSDFSPTASAAGGNADDGYWESLIAGPENAAKKALDQSALAEEFLAAYGA